MTESILIEISAVFILILLLTLTLFITSSSFQFLCPFQQTTHWCIQPFNVLTDICAVQEVWGYRPCLWKMILVGVGVVCSGGLLLLLLYWLPEWGVKGTCTRTSLRDAHTLLLRTTVGNQHPTQLTSGTLFPIR